MGEATHLPGHNSPSRRARWAAQPKARRRLHHLATALHAHHPCRTCIDLCLSFCQHPLHYFAVSQGQLCSDPSQRPSQSTASWPVCHAMTFDFVHGTRASGSLPIDSPLLETRPKPARANPRSIFATRKDNSVEASRRSRLFASFVSCFPADQGPSVWPNESIALAIPACSSLRICLNLRLPILAEI